MKRSPCACFFLAIAIASASAAPLAGDAAIQHLKDTGQYDSLSAVITRARYAAKAGDGTEAKAHAQNPAHGLRSTFTPDGLRLEVRARETTHRVDWRLTSLGYGETQAAVPSGQLTVFGQRVELRREALHLVEWFHNSPGGLEQGFTLTERPAANPNGEPLYLVLAVMGDLAPLADAAGRKLRLRDAAGQTVLTYEKLKVWDATGAELSATMQVADGNVTLAIIETAACYPLTIDPTFAQQAYLKASNTGSGDVFGSSVAISGDTVVVGAFGEDSNATGVNGDGSNDLVSGSGAAYVFVRSGTTWTQQAYLKASNVGTNDNFGFTVAISGDTVVVGAYGEDSNATGVNGDGGNDLGTNSGAAYVFVRSGTTWTQQAYLKATNPGVDDQFGRSVAVSGDTAVIGALGEDSNATGVNGDGNNDLITGSGAAYVFVRNGAIWTQQAYLKASNPGTNDNFGSSVAISGNTVMVGAPGEDSNATGINGDGANDLGTNSGAAYVFVRSGTTWNQQAYLKASNTGVGDGFGNAVAISGDTVVVAASFEDSDAIGINGDGTNDNAPNSGAAYVFVRNGTTWTQQAYLKASNTGPTDQFGFSVALAGDTVVVAATGEDSNATGVNGDGSNNSASASGAAYVFARSGTTWAQQAYLKASNSQASDSFGQSAAVAGNTVVVGAQGESSNATGINGDGSNNSAPFSGAAYVFVLPSATSQPTINAQSLTMLGNGAFQFTFSNPDNLNYNVLATTNLIQPSTNWTVLGTAQNLGGGLYQFSDPTATNYPSRFYQLRFP